MPSARVKRTCFSDVSLSLYICICIKKDCSKRSGNFDIDIWIKNFSLYVILVIRLIIRTTKNRVMALSIWPCYSWWSDHRLDWQLRCLLAPSPCTMNSSGRVFAVSTIALTSRSRSRSDSQRNVDRTARSRSRSQNPEIKAELKFSLSKMHITLYFMKNHLRISGTDFGRLLCNATVIGIFVISFETLFVAVVSDWRWGRSRGRFA